MAYFTAGPAHRDRSDGATGEGDASKNGFRGALAQITSVFKEQISIKIGTLLAGSAIAGLGTAIWIFRAALSLGPLPAVHEALHPPLTFSKAPEVEVDSTHLLMMNNYFALFVPRPLAFDKDRHRISAPPADADKRLGLLVHFTAVPRDFGQVQVRYYLAERTPTLPDFSRLNRDQAPVAIETASLLQGRAYDRYIFLERPSLITPGERIYLVFYQLGDATPYGQSATLITAVPYPIDGSKP